MRYGQEGSIEAPTHLGSHQLPLPPEWLSDDEGVSESRTRARPAPTHLAPAPVKPYVKQHTERSIVQPYVRQETERSIVQQPVPGTRSASSRVRGSEPNVIVAPEASSHKEKSRSASSSKKSKSAAPVAPAPAAAPADPAAALAAMGAIDPLQVPVPPELGSTIYGWIRRLALQADLAGADRVLRDALADMTSSLSVSIVYPGQDGLWSLGADEEIPREAAPIIAVATARRAIVASHTALVPVVTTTETVAVIILNRNPRNPAYHPIEQLAMIALARESAAIMHHLAVTHLQRQSEINADKGGLYRGEALEAHRTRGSEGAVTNLSPVWVKRTYPFLVLAMLIGIVATIFITVPTYSTGMAVVIFDGARITAPAAGTADRVTVVPGQSVKKGDILVRLKSADQEAELTLATAEYENAVTSYLFDGGDEQARKTLATASARMDRAQSAVDARVIRAAKSGTVSDIRVKDGDLLNPGHHILTIVEPGTEPEILAFLPGKDRPRFRKNMKLQVELVGFTKTRELATIASVGTEIVGGEEAARYIGTQLADSLKLQGGNFVIVKARLPSRTFKSDHKTMNYHHGLQAKTEVKVQSKPFLVTLLPALEKYVPN
jgi:membrane fusion protein (multidrug efflux system)